MAAIIRRAGFDYLTDEQEASISQDTRLIGEIASTYGVHAASILRIQRRHVRKMRGRILAGVKARAGQFGAADNGRG